MRLDPHWMAFSLQNGSCSIIDRFHSSFTLSLVDYLHAIYTSTPDLSEMPRHFQNGRLYNSMGCESEIHRSKNDCGSESRRLGLLGQEGFFRPSAALYKRFSSVLVFTPNASLSLFSQVHGIPPSNHTRDKK
jgi:hypothetical protein